MATKTFQGEVIESKDGSFAEKKQNPDTRKMEETGEMITGWKITILLNESTQRQFFISSRSLCYKEAQQIVKGQTVRVHAHATPGYGTEVKYVPVQLETIGTIPTGTKSETDPGF